jgi:hypothetical protein
VFFVLFVFVLCLVPTVDGVIGLSILDCPFCFLYVYLIQSTLRFNTFLNFISQIISSSNWSFWNNKIYFQESHSLWERKRVWCLLCSKWWNMWSP